MAQTSLLRSPLALSARARAKGPLARAADRLGMWWMLRDHYGPEYAIEPAQISRVSWEPYLDLSLERDRERLFPAQAAPQRVELREVAALLDEPDRKPIWMLRDVSPGGGDVPLLRRDFAFPSPHVPLTVAFAEQHASMPENHLVHGRIYAAAGSQPKRAVVIVHGFAANGLDGVARFARAESMAAREIAVVVLSMPYHGLRKPAAARFSGEFFMSGDVVRTFEGVLQAVSDLRAAVAWLQNALGIEKVGLIGASLGGYLATLTAALEPRLSFLYAIAPPIRVTDSIDLVPLGRHMAAGLRAQAFPDAYMNRLQDLVDPARMVPALPTQRMRFIAGRNDLFVPRLHMQRLLESWPGLDVRWHDWGHLTALLAWPPDRLFAEIAGFADGLGF